MPCRELATPKFPPGSRLSSRDEHEVYTPEIVFAPRNYAEVQEIVRCAERERPRRKVHATGSRWSLNAAHREDDYAIVPDNLRSLLFIATRSGAIPRDFRRTVPLREDAFTNAFGYVHVESGMRLNTVYQILVNPPPPVSASAMPSVGGGSGGATLAGATSTGTHGSDVQLRPLADHIRAVHLVGPGGRRFWIERSAPNNITDPGGWSNSPLNGDDFEVIYDDDILFATLVSLGRFGVICSIVYETFAPYYLLESREVLLWQQVRERIRQAPAEELFRSFRLQDTDLRFFQLDFSLGGDNLCYVTRRVEIPGGEPLWDRGFAWPPKDSFLEGAEAVADLVFDPDNEQMLMRVGFGSSWEFIDKMVRLKNGDRQAPLDIIAILSAAEDAPRRDFINFIMKEYMEPHPSQGRAAGASYVIDGGARDSSVPLPPGDSVEFAFDADRSDYTQVVDDVLSFASVPQMIGWMSVRYVKGTQAFLGMQQFEHTVSVEASILKGIPGNERFLQAVKVSAVRNGGIPHWGQMFTSASPQETRSYYGRKLNGWRRALASLSRAQRPDTFENQFCTNAGLTNPRRDTLLLYTAG